MSDLFHIDSKLDIPIYQQLVDVIKANIKSGKMQANTKLPTVRDLADKLGIARGTIKRAYDELELMGIVEKKRGHGTFVSYNPHNGESRKERAMSAIDRMIDELEEMQFSMSEINIFINLRLRERASHQDKIKIGVVECNPETLYQLTDQLREISHIDLFSYLLDDLREYPYKISDEMDLIITTAEHSDELSGIISQGDKILKTALTLMPKSVAGIIKIGPGEKIGIVCSSERFGNMLFELCGRYTENTRISPPLTVSHDSDISKYLAKKDVILVPENYQKYCSEKVSEQLKRFSNRHRLVECSYRIDAGSFMYVRDKIEKLIAVRAL
ncbi:MAG: GntR family transcriptional regulator [Eubacterium sp.]|nr:GntR family transcriptional regulator [Eubacterium sp.]